MTERKVSFPSRRTVIPEWGYRESTLTTSQSVHRTSFPSHRTFIPESPHRHSRVTAPSFPSGVIGNPP
ncbi:hypothetical protein [Halomonas sp. 3F2F]|uniref:hypothetical protein n=1 Tax=Halomonas sp. 3F2F TaxID=1255602 RepID=UPI001867342E|nr:hypothetical protein [Halomonas sp. 3F2F]